MNQGWEETGTGADLYQFEHWRIVKPAPAISSTAASQVARGEPNSGDGKFAPIPIRINFGPLFIGNQSPQFQLATLIKDAYL